MTPYKKAADAFMESDEGKRCVDAESLRMPAVMQQYLTNRILRAFAAGWNAREDSGEASADEQHGRVE